MYTTAYPALPRWATVVSRFALESGKDGYLKLQQRRVELPSGSATIHVNPHEWARQTL